MVIKVAHTSVTHMPRSREAAERLLMGSCSALRVFVIGIEVIDLATDARYALHRRELRSEYYIHK